MSVTLRPMRWWDVEPVVDLERTLFGATAWTAEAFWSELAHPDSRNYLVAQGPDGALLGYAGVMAGGADADHDREVRTGFCQCGPKLGRNTVTSD